jgi:electron transport complex protein RnfE
MSIYRDFTKGIIRENPVFRLLLGMCPVLAVTTEAVNGLCMGAATTFVLIMSGLIISSFRKLIPEKVRIPIFIVVIATFVTIVDMIIASLSYKLYRALGIFIPLIVVNCIILCRAEAFSSKNPVVNSLADALGMGIGFTLSLTVLASVREVLGNGTIFGITILPNFEPILVMILPPGAFIALGVILGIMNKIQGGER